LQGRLFFYGLNENDDEGYKRNDKQHRLENNLKQSQHITHGITFFRFVTSED
jgi:hypothetical protein